MWFSGEGRGTGRAGGNALRVTGWDAAELRPRSDIPRDAVPRGGRLVLCVERHTAAGVECRVAPVSAEDAASLLLARRPANALARYVARHGQS